MLDDVDTGKEKIFLIAEKSCVMLLPLKKLNNGNFGCWRLNC
jgi:hypothetical protein